MSWGVMLALSGRLTSEFQRLLHQVVARTLLSPGSSSAFITVGKAFSHCYYSPRRSAGNLQFVMFYVMF